MPGRDRTGPTGAGAMTGRGFGSCAGVSGPTRRTGLGFGLGLGMARQRGCGRGFQRFFATGENGEENRREFLQMQRDALKHQLTAIDKQLEGL